VIKDIMIYETRWFLLIIRNVDNVI
jgi:hypothetical protein